MIDRLCQSDYRLCFSQPIPPLERTNIMNLGWCSQLRVEMLSLPPLVSLASQALCCVLSQDPGSAFMYGDHVM